jgi:GDP-4-dehydro-6-deoxy-D-mannose reductase
LEKGIGGEAYNAGRGETFSMQSILDRLVAMAKVKVDVLQKADRKADTAVTRADATKLKRTTGWEPRIELDDTLAAILAWWRTRND